MARISSQCSGTAGEEAQSVVHSTSVSAYEQAAWRNVAATMGNPFAMRERHHQQQHLLEEYARRAFTHSHNRLPNQMSSPSLLRERLASKKGLNSVEQSLSLESERDGTGEVPMAKPDDESPPPHATSVRGKMQNQVTKMIFEGAEVNVDPSVWIYPNFLTPVECAALIKLAEPRYKPSLTSLGGEGAQQFSYSSNVSRNRTSLSAHILHGETQIVAGIEVKLAAIAGRPIKHLEHLVIVRYESGQYFKEHHDGHFRPVTVLVYLNDVEKGGHTKFSRINLSVKPSQGMALVWPNCLPDGTADYRTMHSGEPPEEGCLKIAVNCFFNTKPAQEIALPDKKGPYCPY